MEQQVDNIKEQLFKQTLNNIKNGNPINYGEALVSISFIRNKLTNSKCSENDAYNYTLLAIRENGNNNEMMSHIL